MSKHEDAERRYAQIEGERDYQKGRADRMEAERDEAQRIAHATLDQRDSMQETARLAERFAKAKGRHHSQHAMCDLLEHFGMPCTRPDKGGDHAK